MCMVVKVAKAPEQLQNTRPQLTTIVSPMRHLLNANKWPGILGPVVRKPVNLIQD